MTATHTPPHAPYINAIEAALTEAGMEPERVDAFEEDSYDVPYLRGVITLTPETSGIHVVRFPHGLILVWDWHTGRDEDYDRGPIWQWARLNEDGSNSWPFEELPVPGWVMPATLAGAAVTLAHTGTATPMTTGWHQHLRAPVQDAIEAWAAP
ncbi:hypothetical protein ACFWH4_01005 [Streptomyces sp. NPDC127091]|uniref:hypothetical protein n=1 Tax=Streptomyces sp. NPDC127091 TaxID=3347134 RepID=UPI00364FC97E